MKKKKDFNVRVIYHAIRQEARNVFLRIAGCNAKPSKSIHIISGHMSHRTEPDIKYMERTMERLSKKVTFINIEDAVEMICQHKIPSKPLCAFTFDDGFDDCYYNIAPVLEKYKVNAIFFVNPNFVEGDESYIKHFTKEIVETKGKRPMRWEQLIDLQNRGFIIGAHTMDHYLTSLDDEKSLEYQIVNCKKVIEAHTGRPCDYFAWPYGRIEHTSQKAVEIACKNYKYVFSQTDYKHYFSFNGQVINRRHFEPFWPFSHIRYFLSKTKRY